VLKVPLNPKQTNKQPMDYYDPHHRRVTSKLKVLCQC